MSLEQNSSICLTKHGDEVISSTNKEQQKLMKKLLSSLTQEEQNTFLELLQRMLQPLNEVQNMR